MQMSIERGNPAIGRCEVTNDNLLIDIMLPGVPAGLTTIVAQDYNLTVKVEEKTRYVQPFEVFFKGTRLNFKELQYDREDGILYLTIPIVGIEKNIHQVEYTV